MKLGEFLAEFSAHVIISYQISKITHGILLCQYCVQSTKCQMSVADLHFDNNIFFRKQFDT